MLSITSKAFSNSSDIPIEFTKDGDNLSPPLDWEGSSRECQGFALICTDPDAPKSTPDNPFVHWMIYNIPFQVRGLPAGLDPLAELHDPVRAEQGINSFGELGYAGPLPPVGDDPHRYIFTLYTLEREIIARPGVDYKTLKKAIDTYAISSAELQGQYARLREQALRPVLPIHRTRVTRL